MFMNLYTQISTIVRREPLVLAAARICVFSCLLAAVAASGAAAQQGGPDGDARRFAGPRGGDLQPGDRIIIVTRGDSTRVDTVTVQSDRTISLQNVPPIQLEGVARPELQSYLGEQLHQYVKRDVVRVIPLVPVGVLGEVVHPGYYRVPLQITVGDLLMVAGGPSPQADLTHALVRRGRTTVVDEHTLRDAMVRGLPLAELGIDAGDEVVLNPQSQHNWVLVTQIVGVATGLLLTLHSLKLF
jgi:protein involved in polysaccharide export with SLBB domain